MTWWDALTPTATSGTCGPVASMGSALPRGLDGTALLHVKATVPCVQVCLSRVHQWGCHCAVPTVLLSMHT